MSKCPKCGAPARHMPPDGDFRYDPPSPAPTPSAPAADCDMEKALAWANDRWRMHGNKWAEGNAARAIKAQAEALKQARRLPHGDNCNVWRSHEPIGCNCAKTAIAALTGR